MFKKYIFTGAFVLFAILVAQILRLQAQNNKLKNENVSYESISKSKTAEVKTWRDKYNKYHYKTQVATVSSTNVLKEDPEFQKLLSEINGIKKNLKNLVSASQTSTSTETNIYTKLKDSIINDTVLIECMEPYEDKFLSIKGCFGPGQKLNVTSRDSLTQAIFKSHTHKFLFIKWGKVYESEIVSANPNTVINYNRTVQILKRKK